ncbi:MAG: four helix bundle protein [Bdellovibrionales bacterium]|nr:four helix bundle protein [Bdellovibrionales bacterium]
MSVDPKLVHDAYELSRQVFHRTKSYPKALRPTLGRRLEERSVDLAILLKQACFRQKGIGSGPPRATLLTQASQVLDEVRLLLQLGREMQAIPVGAFGEFSALTDGIGRQIGGFLRVDTQKTGFGGTVR